MAVNLADTTITAANHTNKRALGAHLANGVFNVKGFNATGDGVTDDTAEIQAATDACVAAGGGTVFFPGGSYKVSSAINFDLDDDFGIRFLGQMNATLVHGLFNGFIFDRSLASPNNTDGLRGFEKMSIINSHATGGCIRIGSSIGAFIKDCQISGNIGITTEDQAGISSANTLIMNCQITGRGTYTDAANAIIIGGGGSIHGVDVHGHKVGVRAYGSGFYSGGCRIERCDNGYLLGVDSADVDQGLSGFSIGPHTFEGDTTAIDFVGTCTAGYLNALYIQGHGDENSGPVGSLTGAPTVNTAYGIRVRADTLSNSVFNAITIGNTHDTSAVEIEDSTARANLFFCGVTANVGVGTGDPWVMPTKAHTAVFKNCNTTPTYTFANLPASPLEGEEYTITNSNTAVWGATAAAGGSNRVLVRYNGTNWTVVAS